MFAYHSPTCIMHFLFACHPLPIYLQLTIHHWPVLLSNDITYKLWCVMMISLTDFIYLWKTHCQSLVLYLSSTYSLLPQLSFTYDRLLISIATTSHVLTIYLSFTYQWQRSYRGFLKIGVLPGIIHFNGDFPWNKPSIYGGTPMTQFAIPRHFVRAISRPGIAQLMTPPHASRRWISVRCIRRRSSWR